MERWTYRIMLAFLSFVMLAVAGSAEESSKQHCDQLHAFFAETNTTLTEGDRKYLNHLNCTVPSTNTTREVTTTTTFGTTQRPRKAYIIVGYGNTTYSGPFTRITKAPTAADPTTSSTTTTASPSTLSPKADACNCTNVKSIASSDSWKWAGPLVVPLLILVVLEGFYLHRYWKAAVRFRHSTKRVGDNLELI